MSPAALQEALDAITLWPIPPQVHFTGGEPFLQFELLLDGVHWAVERGIVNYVETSASWCIDDEEVHRRFVTLREAGLEAILISCSPFHAEKIPPARTLRAVQASLEVFGTRGTIVYLPEYLKIIQLFDIDRPTPLSHYEETFGVDEAGRVLWQGYGIISGGRAGYKLGHLIPKYPAESFAETNCMLDLLYAHHSHFDLYGNYISGFCGGLTIGSWRELHQVFEDFRAGRYPPLIEILIARGPYGLAQMAREDYGYQPNPAGYTGKCHLCVDVRRHMVRTGDFFELSPLPFYDHL
ncbi:MAG: hypothetical protein JSV37_10355 [Anaerolineaceae bacterium]|nr:MAG: hypothetical protein JSV37_10355 [Anaerolineaceae bacterium]